MDHIGKVRGRWCIIERPASNGNIDAEIWVQDLPQDSPLDPVGVFVLQFEVAAKIDEGQVQMGQGGKWEGLWLLNVAIPVLGEELVVRNTPLVSQGVRIYRTL